MTRTAKLLNDIQTYHTMADQAGRVANLAGAKLLVLTHTTPPLPNFFANAVIGSSSAGAEGSYLMDLT